MNADSYDERGQTSIDFAVAMGIFLVALTTVVAFMPGMTAPFTGGQENPLVADRIAAQLVDYQLGDPSQPSVLNRTCTMYFFNGTTPDPCPSFDNTEDVNGKLGVSDRRFVNVSLQQNVTGDASPEIICGDGSGGIDEDCSGGGPLLAVGPSPPAGSGSVTVARRRALLGERVVYVVVNVWT